jgi:hypothetical protein
MENGIENKDKINYMYICIPNVNCAEWEDYIITIDKEKAIDLLKEKKYRVEIFKKNKLGYFIPSYDCLYIGEIINQN